MDLPYKSLSKGSFPWHNWRYVRKRSSFGRTIETHQIWYGSNVSPVSSRSSSRIWTFIRLNKAKRFHALASHCRNEQSLIEAKSTYQDFDWRYSNAIRNEAARPGKTVESPICYRSPRLQAGTRKISTVEAKVEGDDSKNIKVDVLGQNALHNSYYF